MDPTAIALTSFASSHVLWAPTGRTCGGSNQFGLIAIHDILWRKQADEPGTAALTAPAASHDTPTTAASNRLSACLRTVTFLYFVSPFLDFVGFIAPPMRSLVMCGEASETIMSAN